MRTLAAASILIALLPPPVLARASSPEIAVTYADLDLRSSEGIAALDHRLKRAVEIVCNDYEGVTDLASRSSARRCVKTHIAQLADQRSRVISASITRTASAR